MERPGDGSAGIRLEDVLIYSRDFARIGRHLVPMASREERTRWLNGVVAIYLSETARFQRSGQTQREEAWGLFHALEHLRKAMTAVLDQIDHEAPAPLDAHAMTLYRASGDPARMVQAAYTLGIGSPVPLDEFPGLAEFERLQTISTRLVAEQRS